MKGLGTGRRSATPANRTFREFGKFCAELVRLTWTVGSFILISKLAAACERLPDETLDEFGYPKMKGVSPR